MPQSTLPDSSGAGIFSGVTLAVAGAGLPDLGGGSGFTVPDGFKQWCSTPPLMGCAAIMTIYAHIVDPTVGGTNSKSVEGDGLNGRARPVSNVLRFMAQSTEPLPWLLARVLDGEQMSTGFSSGGIQFGCAKSFPPTAADKPAACTIPSTCTTDACIPVACIPQACLAPGVTQTDLASFTVFGNVPAKYLIPPEQSLYNILRDTFDDTTNVSFFGGTPGTVHENYLQIYSGDFQYATAHVNAPAPAIATVANAEGENPVIAPNTWVEVKGSNLAPVGFERIWGESDFSNNKMPTAISGVSATVNGKSAFVYYISPTQVNILTPPDPMSGPTQVQVTTNGQTASFTAQAQTFSPSFFVFNGGPYVAATHANGTYLGPASLYPGSTTPAKLGETIVLYANGFGPVSNSVVSGSATQSGTLSPLPLIKIGGVTATVTFAGLVLPGEFQFNVVVPLSLADGDQPVTAAYNGLNTQAGTLIRIQQ